MKIIQKMIIHQLGTYFDKYKTNKLIFNSTLNYKFSNRLNLRAGVIADLIKYNFYRLSSEHEGDPLAGGSQYFRKNIHTAGICTMAV